MPAKTFGRLRGTTGVTDNAVLLADGTNGNGLKTSSKTIVTTLGTGDTTIPTSLAVKTITDGKRNYHGFVNRTDSTITWSNSTKTLTLTGTFTYWYQGVVKTHSDSPSVTMTAGQISTASLYYVYFNSSDVLVISTVIPAYETSVFVAMVYWNTSVAIVREERHGYRLSQDWRRWAHNTIGCRYGSGLALTIPVNTGYPNTTVSVATGTIWDEDIDYSSIVPTTQVRTFYQNSSTTLTFTNTLSAQPYKYGTTGVQFVDSTNAYALTDCATGRYVNVWVYAVPGIIPATGVYGENVSIVLETIAGSVGYTTVANARAVAPPNLTLLTAISPEIKLIYRLVVKGDGVIDTIVAADDYRTQTTLAGGSVSSIDAASVISTPVGTISAITVQGAIAELESEKAAIGQKLDDFGTPDDNTDLNANTTNHGLVVKAVDPVTGRYINVVGIGPAETAYTNKALYDDAATPVMNGAAATGTQLVAARRDHVHATDTALIPNSIVDAKGDLIVATAADTVSRLAVGSTTGHVLTIDPTEATGLKWAAAGSSSGASYQFRRTIEGEIYPTVLMYYRVNSALTLTEARASIGSIPVGASILVDVRKLDSTHADNIATASVFSSDTPITLLTSGSLTYGTYSLTGTLDSGRTSCAAGDLILVVVTQVGSTSPGQDLEVVITF
jgi:hypothetical protein